MGPHRAAWLPSTNNLQAWLNMHAPAQEVVHAALGVLDEVAAEDATQSESPEAAATAAHVARIFEALLSGECARQLFDWESGPHAITKALWQQRAFSGASELILQV